MFIKNNEILETIGEKSFEVSTPLNLNGKKISSFSSDIEIPSQMDFGNQIFPFLLPSMKRKSIYSKLPQNKLNILNNLDNELSLKNANDHKIIYK